MQVVHNKSMQQLMVERKYAWTHERDERPHVSLKKNWMPMMIWKDDALILPAVREGELLNFTKTKALTTFATHLAVAEKFGFIEQPQGVTGYKLGPNLQFTLPTVAYRRFIVSKGQEPDWKAFFANATHRCEQGGDRSSVSREK